MPDIKVHLLNFHGPVTHIEIMLENLSVKPSTFYSINRWAPPLNAFYSQAGHEEIINQASSTYSFDIEADPDVIVHEWKTHYQNTLNDASIIGHNCAVSAQWFLTTFADIPAPNFYSAPISINHLVFGLFVPSFIPVGITLPGRIMSNAKFYIEARDNPEIADQYSYLFLNVCLAISALTIAASITGIILASILLTGGLSIGIIVACAAVGAASSFGLFASINTYAAKDLVLANEDKNDDLPNKDEDKRLLLNRTMQDKRPRKANVHGLHDDAADTIRQRKGNVHGFYERQDAEQKKEQSGFVPFRGASNKLGTY